jgi:hypothetical protein
MKITEPVIIRKLKTGEYEATGKPYGYGVIRRRGRSEEEAKDRFFQVCTTVGSNTRRGYRGTRLYRAQYFNDLLALEKKRCERSKTRSCHASPLTRFITAKQKQY